MGPAPAVRARGLTKRFNGAVVVDGIDLEVRSGECFGLLGPNGAGKSTTIRMILGLSPISAGSLEVLGRPIPRELRAVRARCGVVPQSDNLDVDLTVAANLRVYASYFGLKGAVVDERIDRLLDFFQLGSRRDAPIESLSGGMQRRLSLARALINDPELVILDEPTTGLDPQARRLVWQQLRRLREQGRTLLAELVARHVEPHVIEVPMEQVGAPQVADLAGVRAVHAGDTAYLYTAEPQPVLDRLHASGQTTHFHRPANLEDVFLRLTGHELQEG